VAGVNAIDSLMGMQPQDALYTFNLMPSEYGLRLRKGYRQWAINCKEDPARASDQSVRTLIPFVSNIRSLSNNRLFASTAEGIWDVTLYNEQAPNQEVAYDIANEEAGYGVWCEFTGDAATGGTRGHYLLFADAVNGVWVYTEDSDAWARPADWTYEDPDDPATQIPFPVEDVAFIMVHKQRIWVILENSSDAWYLPVAGIAGELKRYTFGSKLPNGGNLVGLYNWTIDGGDGVDDYLVAIGRGGDVIIYQGEDPEITPDGSSVGAWTTRGTWFIGAIPNSRRIASEYGPDLYILSIFGLSSLSDLLQGNPAETNQPSRRVNRFLRADIETGKNRPEWQVVVNPADGFLQIVTPKPFQTPFVQYNLNLQTGAWGFWESVPMLCGQVWEGDYFMGGLDGTVWINDGGLDNEELLDPNQWQDDPVGTPGAEWSVAGDEYTVDGSNLTQSDYEINLIEPLEAGVKYQVSYKIKDGDTVGAQHSLSIGGVIILPWSVGNGVFVGSILGNGESVAAIQAATQLQATFYDISIRREKNPGDGIEFRNLTSFQAPQGHTQHARVGLIRTVGILAGNAAINTDAVYDYKVETPARFPPQVAMPDPSYWDSALWDNDVWDFVLEGQNFTSGALGMGRAFAILTAGSAQTRVNIVAWDLSFTVGGFL